MSVPFRFCSFYLLDAHQFTTFISHVIIKLDSFVMNFRSKGFHTFDTQATAFVFRLITLQTVNGMHPVKVNQMGGKKLAFNQNSFDRC